MISFELDASKQGIEIFLDPEGIDELISYLNFINKSKESFHLVAGGELSEELLNSSNTQIKHVKLVAYQ